MTAQALSAAGFFRQVADSLQSLSEHEHGPPVTPQAAKLAGQACVTFCDGNQDLARTLWKLIVQDLGYMPECVATALIRAANTDNLVPDVTAPVPT